MFMDREIQHSKDDNSSKLLYRFNVSSIKITAKVFIDIHKLIIKYIWKIKELE